MFLIGKKSKPEPHIPDITRVVLYQGQFYGEKRKFTASHNVYTLREWETDEDVDFPALVMDCAAAILENMLLVVNCVSCCFSDSNIMEEPEIQDYLANVGQPAYYDKSCFVTVSCGIDHTLIQEFFCDDEMFAFEFCGYRELPKLGEASPDYDVRVECSRGHYSLLIETPHGIGKYEETIRKVCEKYGKTLMLVGFENTEMSPEV